MSIRKLLAITSALACCALGTANAGTYKGTIAKLEQYIDGRVFVAVVGTETRAACATHPEIQLVFNTTQPSGRGVLSQLLMAQTTNRVVTIGGGNACTLAVGYEDLYVVLND